MARRASGSGCPQLPLVPGAPTEWNVFKRISASLSNEGEGGPRPGHPEGVA